MLAGAYPKSGMHDVNIEINSQNTEKTLIFLPTAPGIMENHN